MQKSIYFDAYDQDSWPPPSRLAPYFLTAAGRDKFFESENDSWGLKLEGADGTGRLPVGKGRIDVSLTIQGHRDAGVLLQYRKYGGDTRQTFYTAGDLGRLHERVTTMHGDRMPVGLFIPFETAWLGVEEFMKREGALPKSVSWIKSNDIPQSALPLY